MSLPIGPTDVKVELPHARPGFLPDIYIQDDHPLHKGHGKAYYYIQDGSPKGMARTVQLERNCIRVPLGSESVALGAGFMKILPGDTVFERLLTSSASGKDDVALGWLNGPELYSEQLRRETIALRDFILGVRAERSNSMPTKGKRRVGGTRFERDFPEGGNARNGRCYPIGMSYEAENKMYAPCAQGKLSIATREILNYRADLLRVTVDMAIRNLEAGPDEIAECLAINHELANGPSFGIETNFAFGSVQVNIAEVNGSSSVQSLNSSLGSAGEEHIDPRDSPPHYTNVSPLSDLPPGCDPGRFFILYPGIFYELNNFTSFCFSGLRRHVGTPPIAAPGTSVSDLQWATRVTLVSYPPTGSKSYSQRRPLCANGNNKCFNVSPEMITPAPVAKLDVNVNHSTFVKEGPSVMPRHSLVQFLCRSLLQIALFVLRQLPEEFGVRVDSDAFLGSFSYVSSEGQRESIGSWPDGPGWRSAQSGDASPTDAREQSDQDVLVDQLAHLEVQTERWNRYYSKYAGHIPHAVAVRKGINPIEGWNGRGKPPKLGSSFLPPDKAMQLCCDVALDRGSVYVKPNVIRTYGRNATDSSSTHGNDSDVVFGPPADDTNLQVVPYAQKPVALSNMYGSASADNLMASMAFQDDYVLGGVLCMERLEEEESTRMELEQVHPPRPEQSMDIGEPIYSDESRILVGPEVMIGVVDDASSPSPGSTPGVVEDDSLAVAEFVTADSKPVLDDFDSLFGSEDGELMDVDTDEENVVNSNVGQSMDIDRSNASPLSDLELKALENIISGNVSVPSELQSQYAYLSNVVPLSDLESEELEETLSNWLQDVDPSGLLALQSQDIDWVNAAPLSDRELEDFENILSNSLQDTAPSGPSNLEVGFCRQPTDAREENVDLITGEDGMSESVDRNEKEAPTEAVHYLNGLPVYLRGITNNVVYADLQSVVQSAIGHGAAASCNRVHDAVEVMRRLQVAVHERPMDLSTFSIINKTWEGLKNMKLDERIETLKLKQLRVDIMLANCTTWMWLEDDVSAAITRIFAGNIVETPQWLRTLVLDVRLAVHANRQVVEFEAVDYGIQVDGTPRAVVDLNGLDSDEIEIERNNVQRAINKIARQWLGFPSDEKSYWQAVYVEALCDNLGLDVLYLDYVWKTFGRVNRQIMGGIRASRLATIYDPAMHPLLDATSGIRRDLEKLASIVRDFFRGRLDEGLHADHIQAGSPRNPLDRLRRDRSDVLQKFVRNSFDFAFRGRSTSNARLDQALLCDPDHYLLFREKAPTRVHMMGLGGPFTPGIARTIEGVFSAIVGRAITFNTEFSRKGRTYFVSPEDFFLATREYGCTSESGYFNKSAYGQIDPGRKVDLVYDYWDALHATPRWPGLSTNEPITFNECYTYFYDKNNLRFRHLGPLGAYLLTADYVYAGVVETPPVDVVANVVKKLNKGAMSALETLGLVPSRSQGIRGRASRSGDLDMLGKFKTADATIRSAIPVEDCEEAGFDFITTEHALCKFSRVVGGKNPIIRL